MIARPDSLFAPVNIYEIQICHVKKVYLDFFISFYSKILVYCCYFRTTCNSE